MRILVTGAAGMLGLDVVQAARAAGVEVVALARADLDVTDASAVGQALEAVLPDAVINCAAWTDVDGAESEPDRAAIVNGRGAGNVAAAAAACGAWTLHVSSDYVFDGAKRTPYLESDPTGPISRYGISKLAGEHAVAQAAPGAHTIIRSSWLFGAGGPCFPATILRAASERDELTVVDDQVGCPTFTAHLAAALLEIAAQPDPPVGVAHVAAGGACSWYELANELLTRAGLQTKVTRGRTEDLGRPAPRPPYSVLGSERTPELPVLPDWRAGVQAFLAETGRASASAPATSLAPARARS